MNITVSPSPLSGTAAAIPSKSDAHRKLICAALSGWPSVISLGTLSKDIEATISCLSALGADIGREGSELRLSPAAGADAPSLDCGESGSTLRFLLPVTAALCHRAAFIGHGRLPSRSISQLMQAMEQHGVRFSARSLPFEISGRLSSGVYRLPGDVSSQYISGLLMALPLLEGTSRIVLTSPLQSRGYVNMTLSALKTFGINIAALDDGYLIPAPQRFDTPGVVNVEGDWSNAAFFLCAGAMSGSVTVSGLDMSSQQGDKVIINILRDMGAIVECSGDCVTVTHAPLKGLNIDVREIPDLLPILAVTAAAAEGETVFTGAARLRDKESDRLYATRELICVLGGDATELADGLIVRGGELRGGRFNSFNDHRMVMAAAIAATVCTGPVTILDAQAVSKSYPEFFEHFRALGGKAAETLETA